MNAASDLGKFVTIYQVLVKNKMAAPGLSVVGIGVGYLLILLTYTVPTGYDEHVGFVGLRLMDASAIVFVVLMVGFGWFWFRFLARKKTFP